MTYIEKILNKLDQMATRITTLEESQQKLIKQLKRADEDTQLEMELSARMDEQIKKSKRLVCYSNKTGGAVRKHILTNWEYIDLETQNKYLSDLDTFRENAHLIHEAMLLRNEGYRMADIYEDNAAIFDDEVGIGVNRIYDCINAARRFDYVMIINGSYIFTENFVNLLEKS